MTTPTANQDRKTEPIGSPTGAPGGEEPGSTRLVWIRDRKPLVIGVIAGLLVVAVLAYVLLRRDAAPVEEAAAESSSGTVSFLMEQQWLIKMKLALVEERSVARQVTATGRVVPAANRHAVVAPPVGGLLAGTSLPRIGQQVGAGQTIAVVQQTATSAEAAQVRAASAQIAVENARLESERRVAAAEVDAARSRLDFAKRDAERAARLYERKAYSQRQLEEARSRLETAQADYNAAVQRRNVLAAAGEVASAKTNVVGSPNASHAVRAPLSGVVTKVHKSLGEQVAPGEPILEVTSLEEVWVEAPIFEKDLARLGGPARAFISTPAYPNEEFPGELVDRGSVIDEQTRAATVVFRVPNAGRPFRIGMQANVRIDAGESVTAMMVPKEAVLDHEGKKIVYVLLTGEEFERREVHLGDEYGDSVAVLEGLKTGERVVTQGAYQLKLQELRPAEAGAHSHET
jgi:cobalt-zinc-cadmium efflux system membrane fusion protein